jgi:mannose-1-phosphate guanylyltransferase/mannose-6-phosphate isomerase
MPQKIDAFALLLAGGSGTRLWPWSREMYPKQLVRFIDQQSLIQHTLNRLLPTFLPDHIHVVCGDSHALDIQRDAKEINLIHNQLVIIEPCARNTAPAILLGTLSIYKKHSDAIIFVFPADHMISQLDIFYKKISDAHQLAHEEYIVTFGITPEYPETGYGYIEASDQSFGEGYKIKRFVEKPDIQTAEKYIQSGHFYWNAGMFAFKASVLIDKFKKHMPDMLTELNHILDQKILDTDNYQKLENISFDFAIMEKTQSGVVLPSNFQWSDIGSWKSLYDFLPKDNNKNVITSEDAIIQDSNHCLVMGNYRLMVLNQLKDIAIIDTPDAIFISDLEHSRDVKNAVNVLRNQKRNESECHIHQVMHWGDILIMDEQPDCVVKKITIHPGAEIPQTHNLTEIKQWYITKGHGLVQIDNVAIPIHAGENITIESRMTVCFQNVSKEQLVFIEISTPIVSVVNNNNDDDDLLFE